MSHQLVWYLLPDDFLEGLERVERAVPIVAIAIHSDRPVPQILPSPSVEIGKPMRATAFLVRPEDLQGVTLVAVPSQGHWAVDGLLSPVIEVRRPISREENVLRAGRLYYTPDFHNDAGAVVKKPEEFLQWARCVFAAFKKGLEYDRELYAWVGPAAREWKASTGGAFKSQ